MNQWGGFSSVLPTLSTPSVSAAAAAKSLQSCLTLCDPVDGSPPGSPIPGILQARILEWVAISSLNAWKWKMKVKSLSRVGLFATPMDCSPPGSSVHGIFQARVLEWGAIAFSTLHLYHPQNYHPTNWVQNEIHSRSVGWIHEEAWLCSLTEWNVGYRTENILPNTPKAYNLLLTSSLLLRGVFFFFLFYEKHSRSILSNFPPLSAHPSSVLFTSSKLLSPEV